MALVAREGSTDEVLAAVAATARETLGYGSVVINVYRPASHDYEAVLVLSGKERAATLLGTANTYEQIHELLLLERFERVAGAFFLPAGTAVWEEMDNTYTAPGSESVDSTAWQPADGLLVRLVSSDGAPLGVVSVDDPSDGRRPGDDDLRLLVAVCSHAALALETAQLREETENHQRALERVIAFGAEVPTGAGAAEIVGQACRTACDAMGFGSAAGFLAEAGELRPTATVGRHLGSWPALPADAERGSDVDLVAAGRPSPRDGRGPRSWRGHLLSVTLRRQSGEVVGGLLLGDPASGELPHPSRFQELRLLADQAVAALGFADREERLADLAMRDPLTGLRNRRDLEPMVGDLIASGRPLAVLACDLDHFKAVNDTFGHEVGDLVLRRFASLLADNARGSDLAIRLGGEEFCLLLPGTDAVGATAVAERIRLDSPGSVSDLIPRQTVSIGVACSVRSQTPADLLAAADAALYAAKREGRNRVRLA